MNPLEIIGELCTLDSAFIRGWRWSFSGRYREAIRLRCAQQRPLFVVAGVLETVVLMFAEIVALVFIVRWVFTL